VFIDKWYLAIWVLCAIRTKRRRLYRQAGIVLQGEQLLSGVRIEQFLRQIGAFVAAHEVVFGFFGFLISLRPLSFDIVSPYPCTKVSALPILPARPVRPIR
jgi:hypothetical protein